MHCGNLYNDTLKILGTHFSLDEKLKQGKNVYITVTNNNRIVKIRKIRNLILEGKILIFKTSTVSKTGFQLPS